jgi:hypothetical protein
VYPECIYSECNSDEDDNAGENLSELQLRLLGIPVILRRLVVRNMPREVDFRKQAYLPADHGWQGFLIFEVHLPFETVRALGDGK